MPFEWLSVRKTSAYDAATAKAFTAISYPYSVDPTVWFTERR